MVRIYSVLFTRNRDVYILKVVTLAIAFSAGIVVALFGIQEFGYDTYYRDSDRVFRVLAHNTDKNYMGNRLCASIPGEAFEAIRDRVGDSCSISRVKALNNITVIDDRHLPTYDQKLHAADRSIHRIFSFNITDGNIDHFTASRRVAITSKSAAKRYFGNEPAIGKTLRLTTFGDTLAVNVVAVFEDLPSNTHEDFGIFISYDSSALAALNFVPDQSGVYARLDPTMAVPLPERSNAHETEYVFQPVGEIYFGPRVLSEEARHGDVYSMVILMCIVSLILLLAICTFISLSTVTLPKRSKEIAVKKLAGTTQLQLVFQFMYESFLLAVLSSVIAMMILFAAAHPIRLMLGIDVMNSLVNANVVFLAIVALMIFAVVISPVFVAIRFIRASPARLLSTDTITFPRFKRMITIVQFGVSTFLIVSSILINRQINYSLIKEPGRNHDQIVYMACPPNIPDSAIHKIKAGWPNKNPNVLDAVAVSQLPNQLKGKEIGTDLFVLEADYNFKDFFQFVMLDGDWFEYTDRDSVVVVNQKGLTKMKEIDRYVIGVIQDINSPFNRPEQPVKIRHAKETTHNWICFRVEEVDIRNTVTWIEERMHAKRSRGRAYYYDQHFETWLTYQDQLNVLSRTLTIIQCCWPGVRYMD